MLPRDHPCTAPVGAAASSAKAKSHPLGLSGPPPASSATPADQLRGGEPETTVRWQRHGRAAVAGAAAAVMPEVSARESAENRDA